MDRWFIYKDIPGIQDPVCSRRPTENCIAATKRAAKLLEKEPKLFAFRKESWVLSDVSSQLKNEGIAGSVYTVWGILASMGLVWWKWCFNFCHFYGSKRLAGKVSFISKCLHAFGN